MKQNLFSTKNITQLLLPLLLFSQFYSQAQKTNNLSKKIQVINTGCFGSPNLTMATDLHIDSLIKHKRFIIAEANHEEANKDSIKDEEITLPKVEYGEFTNLQWRPVVFFNNQLFPSAIISLARYKGVPKDKMLEAVKKPLGFYILSSKGNMPLRWEIECVNKNLFDKMSGYFMYKTKNQLSYLQVDIPWNYKALMNNVTPAPVDVFFRLYDVQGNKVEKLVTVTLRGINECIYRYNNMNLDFEFSAFVQEEDTAIDGILRDALRYKMIDAFYGYQKDSDNVEKQVAVIGRILYNQGFSFSDMPVANTNSGDSSHAVYSLPVRTLQNALRTKVESALDGTIIFASVLKRIGLNPLLVMTNGHSLLGYYVNDSSIHYVQTSLLTNNGAVMDGKFVNLPANAKTSAEKNEAFKRLFALARKEGEDEFYKTDASKRMSVNVSLCRRMVSSLPDL